MRETTKPRKKIVITRKRILPQTPTSKDVGSMRVMLSSTVNGEIQSSTVETSYRSSIDHSSYDDEYSNNNESDSDNDLDDDNLEIEGNDDEEIDGNDDSDEEEGYDDNYVTEPYHIPEYVENIYETTEDIRGDDDDNSEEQISIPKQSESNIPDENQESEYEGDDINSEYLEGESLRNENIEFNDSNNNEEYDDEEVVDSNNQPSFQDIPEYEPSFPELSESLDAPVLLLKTTVLSSTELLTRTVTESRLRTYTFVVTRVSGNEQIVTSTTEVKPQIKTSVITEPHIQFTTLTLLNFDATQTLTDLENTIISTLDNPQPQLLNQDNESNFSEEARYNLATRIMSNGVEVIVAGDKKTHPGEPDFKRLLSTGVQRPVTLKPSTLTDHMVMMMPQEESNIDSLTSLYPSQFVTKTCLTTFTYLTTYLEGSTTTVSSHEQVVSNVATEERNTGKILPTPAMGVTLTQFPNLSVGVFHTTYTYLNTILDGEQPLVLSSEHTVTNTVTAPDDYLSFLKPSEMFSAMKDTNTYYSTIGLEKTLYEGDKTSVISTKEVVTQVVITESVPPQATSVMTSYIALDVEENPPSMSPYVTTDVIKTYFVTYTYHNTITENGKKVVKTSVSTSSDIVTEQLYLLPKKTSNAAMITTSLIENHGSGGTVPLQKEENFKIFATKSYLTTFTYFTTLLQENNERTSTVVSSRTKVVENLVTETVDPKLLDKTDRNAIQNSIEGGFNTIVTHAILQDGQELEITVHATDSVQKIVPTRTLPLEKTKKPELKIGGDTSTLESSSPSIITGSTIVFVDDDPFAQLVATPTLTTNSNLNTLGQMNNLGSLLSSEIIEGAKSSTTTNKSKRATKTKTKTKNNLENIIPSKTKSAINKIKTRNPVRKPSEAQLQNNKEESLVNDNPSSPSSDLLGLGSININSLQALTPVLNAMAGLISTNLNTNRRNDVNITAASTTTKKPNIIRKSDENIISAYDAQNRSPIYIPVGGLADDFEIAESQNIANFDWVDLPKSDQMSDTTPHEASILNGGIPISPGEIITANSDVIVGKPGRIGPRIPSIPLHQVNLDNAIPIGMEPPPVPKKIWKNKNHEYRHIPLNNIKRNKPFENVVHNPNRDDYIGPPPPVQNIKHIPVDDRNNLLYPSRETIGSSYGMTYNIPMNQQLYAGNENHYDSMYKLSENKHEHQNLQETIQQNYNSMAKQSYPFYANGHHAAVPGTPINDFNIKPAVINEPIILPEVIERSTGQPLLVNIQPSQVAFVSIPYNRTTALLYGGSTEPHKNGQYFDDPSPYPEPEFSGIEINNGVPHIASIYQGEPLDQQVNGFIKVENQLINVDPVTSENQNVPVNIKPTRPHFHNGDHIIFGNNPGISLDVPPISFGMMHQVPHDMIKTPDVQLTHQFLSNKYQTNVHSSSNANNEVAYESNAEKFKNQIVDYGFNVNGNILSQTKQKNELQAKPPRVKYNSELVQYMTPPPFFQRVITNRPNLKITPNRGQPTMAPDSLLGVLDNQQKLQRNQPSYHGLLHHDKNHQIKNNIPTYYYGDDQRQNSTPFSVVDLDVGYHKDDDLETEDGEVIQESNSRPLLPGEIPTEILRAHTSNRPRNNSIRFPSNEMKPNYDENFNFEIPSITQKPRPFVAIHNDVQRPIYKANPEKSGQTKPFRFKLYQRQTVFFNRRYIPDMIPKLTSLITESESSGYKLAVPYNKSNRSNNGFGSKTQQSKPISYPTSTASNAHKPVLIFIDETGANEKDFFHYNDQKQSGKVTYGNRRPSVTSLPIDTHTFNRDVTQPNPIFISYTEKTPPSTKNIIDRQSTTELSVEKIERPITQSILLDNLVSSDLNTGEITLPDKPDTAISDMEILRPPPTSKPLDTEIQPPTPITDPPMNGIIITSDTYSDMLNIKVHSPTAKPYVPNHLEEMVPPPVQTLDEEVLGMNPPPLLSEVPQKTTIEPIFSMQIDIPKEQLVSESSSTTERYKYIRTRRPYTRKPNYRTTSTTIPPTTSNRRKPLYPLYNTNIRNRTVTSSIRSTTEKHTIEPSPSIKVKPSMEVIIGKPNIFFGDSEESPSGTEYQKKIENSQGIELSASEISINVPTIEKTTSSIKDMSDLLSVESGVPIRDFERYSDLDTTTNTITRGVHHAGNEIKIVDDTTSASTTKQVTLPTNTNQPLRSTKYITHTKTATVTITKTTVVKSQGVIPSTSTILVTTTEKSTIIDTVTEVHTLVKPTNIVETVTTTIQQASSLYPPEVYGSPYPSIQVKPSLVTSVHSTATSTRGTPTLIFDNNSSEDDDDDDDLEEFIIRETDSPKTKSEEEQVDSNDSILVIMTDKNSKNIIPVPNNSYETQERDEMIASNKVNNILLGGILIESHPEEKESKVIDRCEPECKPSRNELCQKLDGFMRCVCRPGFARMFPDRPCLPTYTYEFNITLERIGKDTLHFFDDLKNPNSTEFNKFAQATREGLNRMVMQSDLRDIFHGVKVHSFEPGQKNKGIVSKFYLQLSDNIEGNRLTDTFQKYLGNNNYSLGGTDIFASSSDVFEARDFDECAFSSFHDCSENAQCFNLKGTYTCSCKEGFSDLSENFIYPGRICSAEQIGCERCSYHGTCYSRGANEVICECFQWYTGESCQINLKVLLIALATSGIILSILLFICIISACVKRKPKNTSGMRFMPQRAGNGGNRNTLDRRAMIQDTSSEDSRSETNDTLPYIQEQTKKPKTALKKTSKVSMQIPGHAENGANNVPSMEQKDRSLTVMIPRAKYHPAPTTSPLMNYTTFDARKPSVPSTANETKLLSYLDAGPSPNKSEPGRRISKAPSDSATEDKPNSRKTSGALISAGFEVSATVVNNMGTLGTTCGTEADRSENATLIQRISTDLLSSTGTRSQFNTLRKSLVDEDLENSTNWLDMVPRVMSVSEARSYDETTIPPPMKSFRTDYDSKHSSQHPNDEANTMAERDLGSTFLLPHTHLYNPDRGSDISGFESL
ncbi:hypothetical protein JTB14_014346 [Gonioctena quinquepunctata]|nr:hypothetical protein JTB14_014346 [Gonioctena quinquepunctata]